MIGAENKRIITDGKRVLGSMGDRACPLGCIYCFVNAKGYQGTGRIDTLEGKLKLADKIEYGDIQVLFPACDVELFLLKDWYSQIIALTEFGLPINIATKSGLNDFQIEKLREIDDILKQKGALLHIGVSLTRLDHWKEIEKHTPSPERRIATAQRLTEAGVATTIVLKPTLPFVPREEFHELVERTASYCESYLTGPLYLTPEMENYMRRAHPGYGIRITHPTWMQGNSPIKTINTDRAIATVKEIAADHKKPVFDNATDAIKLAMSLREL